MIFNFQEQAGRNGSFRFVLTGAEKIAPTPFPGSGYVPANEEYRPRFELTDADGRPFNLNLNLNYNPSPERNQDGTLEGNFFFSAANDVGPPTRFVFYSMKRLRTTVPFEFRNVPMP